MKNKILIAGSICAVVILIGVSFTSVVGYSSKQTNSIESPLYNLRTNRAIENSEDVTTCDYVGKGRESVLSFPTTNDKIVEMLNLIQKMKSKDFERFIRDVIKYGKNMGNIDNIAIREIIKSFYKIRENPEMFDYEELDFTDREPFCGIIWGIYGVITIFITVVVFIFALFAIVIKTSIEDCFESLLATCSTDGCPSYCLWTCEGGACTVHKTNCPLCE